MTPQQQPPQDGPSAGLSGSADGPSLARRLSTTDAVVVGLSAMVGAGVYSVFGPATAAAGSLVLVALGVAAVVAACNALSSTRLAARYPRSGGTYVYGREVLGPWWGFVAGWGFVVGKTASCAAMALTVATYALPGPAGVVTAAQRAVAAAAVVALTLATVRGITRTARLARVLLVVTLTALVLFVVVSASTSTSQYRSASTAATNLITVTEAGWPGVLQAAGLLFFAFAGYARVATLGEEVRRPERLAAAVSVALGVVVVLYLAVGVTVLRGLGVEAVAATTTPVAAAADATGIPWLPTAVRAGAVAAGLGALLALLAGVGRTTLAMAREHDLPHRLAAVDPVHRVPARAQAAVAGVACLLVLVGDLRGVIGFSSFGVLVYYAVANLSALRLGGPGTGGGATRAGAVVAVVGLTGCVVLVATLPATAVVAGLCVFALGVAGRWVRLLSAG
ncbi:amino acid/polyamine/organocation transporter (APC superfamily) [Terracoccus luteus]|uniref:Amino acid/polyamine/organocation transporter (APC superfamily) n=1 Tax=Terracoccus luteus TaxID=53356 RepID=A0A495XWZ6_9MICO|nr:APC family permease [Terracoccus luteus]RKT79120.1 amino acid/polyamine/organocation transporter (APC superfamily) [Terracoccus luteus]